MSNEDDLDVPLTAKQLVVAELIETGERGVYEAIYDGMEHFRRGRAIRVTRRQWRAYWESGLVPAGTYKVNPARSEAALRRAAKRDDGSN
jgi:hypothetical protein